MGVIGYHVFNGPAGKVSVPIVEIGDGPGPPILRHHTATGTGQFALVERGDNRASGYSVYTHKGLFALAKDARTEIRYDPNRSVSVGGAHWESGKTSRVLLGRTFFNRVTRLAASLRLGANSYCTTWDIDAHWEQTTGYAWMEAIGPTTKASSAVTVTAAGHHPGFSAWWQTGWQYASGDVAIDLPAGQYDVYLCVKFTWAGTPHSGSAGEASALCSTWKEIAR